MVVVALASRRWTYLSMLIATKFRMEAVELVTSTATNISQMASPSCQTSFTCFR